VRKYLSENEPPQYAPRPKRPDILDPYKDFITVRLKDGVWNAVVLMRELKARGYSGQYTAIKDYLRPRRQQAHAAAVRRFETPPGKQAQVDWASSATSPMRMETGSRSTAS